MTAAILARHGLRAGRLPVPAPVLVHRAHPRRRHRPPPRSASPPPSQRARRAAEKVDRTLEEGDRVTQFEALTAAAYSELAERGRGRRRRRGRPRRALGRDERDPLAGAGPDERRPRAHALARPDDRRHRGGEARHRAPGRDARRRRRPAPRRHDAVPSACAPSAARRSSSRPPTAGSSCSPRALFQRRNFAVARAAAEAYHGPLDDAAVSAAAAADARARALPGRRGGARDGHRRRPQRRGHGVAGGLAADLRGRTADRRLRVRARRQGRRGDAPRAPAAVRRGRLHPEREPAGAAAGDARVARRPGRRAAGPDGPGPAARARSGARGRRSGRRRRWPPARSTSSPICCARPGARGGRCCERRRSVDARDDRPGGHRRGRRDPRVLRARIRIRPICSSRRVRPAHHAALGPSSESTTTA